MKNIYELGIPIVEAQAFNGFVGVEEERAPEGPYIIQVQPSESGAYAVFDAALIPASMAGTEGSVNGHRPLYHNNLLPADMGLGVFFLPRSQALNSQPEIIHRIVQGASVVGFNGGEDPLEVRGFTAPLSARGEQFGTPDLIRDTLNGHMITGYEPLGQEVFVLATCRGPEVHAPEALVEAEAHHLPQSGEPIAYNRVREVGLVVSPALPGELAVPSYHHWVMPDLPDRLYHQGWQPYRRDTRDNTLGISVRLNGSGDVTGIMTQDHLERYRPGHPDSDPATQWVQETIRRHIQRTPKTVRTLIFDDSRKAA